MPKSIPTSSTRHGGTRGADLPRLSSNTEGRFGRMFRALPPATFSDDDLKALGQNVLAAKESDPTAEEARPNDDEENVGIAAGYTYFGQFIDHDLTFDPASHLQKENDPEGLVDFRTPRFDLDCVYGRGPDDQPYMYKSVSSGVSKFLLGNPLKSGDLSGFDLPRFQGRALIGDKRNDENTIVSQMQSGFLQFHNRMVDQCRDLSFDEVARLVRWHYQWCVLHDFLPKIVGKTMVHSILPHLKNHTNIYVDRPVLRFYHPKEDPFIPIEFTAAAYRFGHSMVRPLYRLNEALNLPSPADPRFPIFSADPKNNLNGFQALQPEFVVDWGLFFGDIQSDPHAHTRKRIQPAYKIDTSLVNPLKFLPEFSKPKLDGGLETDADGNPIENPLTGPSNLALRNLRRGLSMALPSGQTVARAMDEQPIADADLLVGKATWEGVFGERADRNPSIEQFGASFKNNAPLWFYILAEAQHQWKLRVIREGKQDKEDLANAVPVRLGPIGGRIVAEVVIGLLLGDRNSFLRQDPHGTPRDWSGHLGNFGILQLLTGSNG